MLTLPLRTRWQRAATELPPEQHDAFAYFLSAMPAGSGGQGATHALWLPGLSQRATLDMALQAGEGLERTRYVLRLLCHTKYQLHQTCQR